MIKEDLFNCGKYIKVGGVDILICKYYIDTSYEIGSEVRGCVNKNVSGNNKDNI
jgi:hypothetical protein